VYVAQPQMGRRAQPVMMLHAQQQYVPRPQMARARNGQRQIFHRVVQRPRTARRAVPAGRGKKRAPHRASNSHTKKKKNTKKVLLPLQGTWLLAPPVVAVATKEDSEEAKTESEPAADAAVEEAAEVTASLEVVMSETSASLELGDGGTMEFEFTHEVDGAAKKVRVRVPRWIIKGAHLVDADGATADAEHLEDADKAELERIVGESATLCPRAVEEEAAAEEEQSNGDTADAMETTAAAEEEEEEAAPVETEAADALGARDADLKDADAELKLNSLKVSDLKKELTLRGLRTVGKKALLKARLQRYVDVELAAEDLTSPPKAAKVETLDELEQTLLAETETAAKEEEPAAAAAKEEEAKEEEPAAMETTETEEAKEEEPAAAEAAPAAVAVAVEEKKSLRLLLILRGAMTVNSPHSLSPDECSEWRDRLSRCRAITCDMQDVGVSQAASMNSVIAFITRGEKQRVASNKAMLAQRAAAVEKQKLLVQRRKEMMEERARQQAAALARTPHALLAKRVVTLEAELKSLREVLMNRFPADFVVAVAEGDEVDAPLITEHFQPETEAATEGNAVIVE